MNLTVEQQAAVAVQAAHIPGGNASFSTVYSLSLIHIYPDGALSDRKIQIQNADGKLVGEQSFEADDLQEGAYSGTVTLTDTGLTTSYTVQILSLIHIFA